MHTGTLWFCDPPPNLKPRLGKGVLAVIAPDPRRVRDALADSQGISSLVLTGDGVHLVVDDTQRRSAGFSACFRAAGIPFDDIHQVTPTIEDRFVDGVTAGGAA